MKRGYSTQHTKPKPLKKLEKHERRDSSLGTPKKKLAPLNPHSLLGNKSDMYVTKQTLIGLTGSPKNRKDLCPLSSSPMGSLGQRKRSISTGKSRFIIKDLQPSKDYSGGYTANPVKLKNNINNERNPLLGSIEGEYINSAGNAGGKKSIFQRVSKRPSDKAEKKTKKARK